MRKRDLVVGAFYSVAPSAPAALGKAVVVSTNLGGGHVHVKDSTGQDVCLHAAAIIGPWTEADERAVQQEEEQRLVRWMTLQARFDRLGAGGILVVGAARASLSVQALECLITLAEAGETTKGSDTDV